MIEPKHIRLEIITGIVKLNNSLLAIKKGIPDAIPSKAAINAVLSLHDLENNPKNSGKNTPAHIKSATKNR